jgi:VanZ family protein
MTDAPPGATPAQIVNWSRDSYRVAARALAGVGIFAIIILSVVPAVDRPVTGAGQLCEHFTAFALVAAAFAIGYRLPLSWLLLLAFLFCGGIELLQVPLPTRHARVSDFVVDFVASSIAIGLVFVGDKLIGAHRRGDFLPPK